jgi:hypothetical protein
VDPIENKINNTSKQHEQESNVMTKLNWRNHVDEETSQYAAAAKHTPKQTGISWVLAYSQSSQLDNALERASTLDEVAHEKKNAQKKTRQLSRRRLLTG